MASMFPAPLSPPAPQAAPCGLLTYAVLTTATNGWAECLGSGSYGAVYAGVLNGERVAVKRFRQKDSGTDSFLREVAVAALVQHPHVLRVVAMVRARPTRYACLARQAPRRGAASLRRGSSELHPLLSWPALAPLPCQRPAGPRRASLRLAAGRPARLTSSPGVREALGGRQAARLGVAWMGRPRAAGLLLPRPTGCGGRNSLGRCALCDTTVPRQGSRGSGGGGAAGEPPLGPPIPCHCRSAARFGSSFGQCP